MKKIVTGNFFSYEMLTAAVHKEIQKDLPSILKTIAEEIKRFLIEYIQLHWYAANSPQNYRRTYEVINSITCSDVKDIGNTKEIWIYFDESKIGSYQTPAGEWNQHMSVDGSTSWGSHSIGWWVVYWMNEGQDSPLYSYDGIDFIENVTRELTESNKVVSSINKMLMAKGYKINIK